MVTMKAAVTRRLKPNGPQPLVTLRNLYLSVELSHAYTFASIYLSMISVTFNHHEPPSVTQSPRPLAQENFLCCSACNTLNKLALAVSEYSSAQ
jgi:hypothetical protein